MKTTHFNNNGKWGLHIMNLGQIVSFETIWRNEKNNNKLTREEIVLYLTKKKQFPLELVNNCFALYDFAKDTFDENQEKQLNEIMEEVDEMRNYLMVGNHDKGYFLMGEVMNRIGELFGTNYPELSNQH